jgi:hypothetical protein
MTNCAVSYTNRIDAVAKVAQLSFCNSPPNIQHPRDR